MREKLFFLLIKEKLIEFKYEHSIFDRNKTKEMLSNE